MEEEQASERDILLMDQVLREARLAFSEGGAGVAALLASPEQIITIARNTIQETGDLTDHAEWFYSVKSGGSFKRWMISLARRLAFTLP